jgi:hypothetical protein
MPHYTVPVPESATAMGLENPLNALEAYHKVGELRDMGFNSVTLINVEAGERITNVAALVRDSPNA